MRFVHSLWSSPSLNYRWNFDAETATLGNIWYYTLSVAYIQRLKEDIVLYTDTFGKECLDHIPYKNIYSILDDKLPVDTCPIMWACSKFYALKNEPLGSIHIDGDVFIKSSKCLDIINSESCDMFCQGEEDISFMLHKLVKEGNYTYEEMGGVKLNYYKRERMKEKIKFMGILHLTQISRFNDSVLPRIHNLFQKTDNELYTKTCEHIENIKKERN